jgi:hypothetical protein
MLQVQAHDEVGFIEIEAGGAVFFRTREGAEHYIKQESLTEELQGVLAKFVKDSEAALNDALGILQDGVSGIGVDGDV